MRDLAAIYLVEPGHWQWQQRQIFLNVALGGDWILCHSYKLTGRSGQWATRGRGRTAADANSITKWPSRRLLWLMILG